MTKSAEKLNQKGVAHILLLLAAIGVIAFILISQTAEFKDNLFGKLSPKPSSVAAGPGVTFVLIPVINLSLKLLHQQYQSS